MYELIKNLIMKSQLNKEQKEEFDFINESNKELFDKVIDLYKED